MFSVIIPVYNEEENLLQLVDEIKASLSDTKNYEIIFINDASTDNTFEILKNIKDSKIIILNNKINRGQSFSISYGIKKSFFNTIITIDGDGQNDPKDIPNLLKHYLNSDSIKLVGGIRFVRKDNFLKIISSKIANYLRSRILKDNCNDTGCSLKIFDKQIFLNFPYFDGIHRFLPALFSGYGFKTKFINVNHRSRKYGYSKYGTFNRLFKGIRDIIKVKKILNKKKII